MNRSALKANWLIDPERKVRPLWRALLFYVLGNWALIPLLERAYDPIARAFHMREGLTAANIALDELILLIATLICTALFARYEGRRVDSYGLPRQLALGALTWEGALAGVVMAASVALGMYLLGGMQVLGLATTGSALALSALGWLIANILIGVAEEYWYRSYILQTLWKSLGFWPAASLIALNFAADHYFTKTGENIWDVITLVSLSLLLCYSVLSTGTLWFAVGFHVAFDYMQLFVIGTPNGAQVPVGRLMNVRFAGPEWLTGGALGTEASFLMYPMIILLWLYIYIWWRFPALPAVPRATTVQAY